MRSFLPVVILVPVLGLMPLGCGTKKPADLLTKANKTFLSEKDLEKAQKLYLRLLDWEGEGGPSKIQRFEASLNLIRCKVSMKDFEGAMTRLKEMQKEQGDIITYQNYCTILGDLLDQKAISHAIDLLAAAGELFPDQKEVFKEHAKKIEERSISDELLTRLKSLPYL